MALASSLTFPVSHNLSSAGQVDACKLRISVSKRALSRNSERRFYIRTRICAINGNNAVSDELRDNPVVNGVSTLQLNGNGNGAVATSSSDKNGSVQRNLNGNGDVRVSLNGWLGDVDGNGVAVEVVEEISSSKIVAEPIVMVKGEKEEKKKKSVEEIGQEDAWFKKDGRDKVEVSVAPGGRWSRFKTYSTIQRTLEIWGFVLTFVFRVWLNNQKFTYRGGMTDQKKVSRRKELAKWLKENILRLGPTFIKIGQQFSTRVDILAQEYVDQLSELQEIDYTKEGANAELFASNFRNLDYVKVPAIYWEYTTPQKQQLANKDGGGLEGVMFPSLAHANTLYFQSAYNVQVVVEDNEPEERLINRFRREVMRAGVIQEVKRRRFFENKQDEKKRRTRDAAKRNSRRRRGPFQPRTGGPSQFRQDSPNTSAAKAEDDEDNWEMPDDNIPF